MEYLVVIREVLTILSIIITAIIALPFIRKKLSEDHLAKKIAILETNQKEYIPKVNYLINKYNSVDDNDPLRIKDLQNIYISIRNLKNEMLLLQGEPATLIISLELYLRNLIKVYKQIGYHRILIKNDVLNYICYILEEVEFFLLKNIPIPNNTSIQNQKYVNDRITKYVNNSSINTYHGFEIGQINDPVSAIYPIIFERIISSENEIMYSAIYKSFGINIKYSVVRLLVLNDYYAPILIRRKDISELAEAELMLIGFRIVNDMFSNRKYFNLYYINTHQSLKYINTITKYNIYNFYDSYLGLENRFEKDSVKSVRIYNEEIICVCVALEDIKSLYRKYQYYIDVKLCDEKKGIFA